MEPNSLNDLSASLGDRYQIVSELSHSGGTHTYLARDLTLNRDVTITVARAGDSAMLRSFAADADLLRANPHPNILSVLETRWLDDQTFMIVRERVTGSTLDQLGDAASAIPRPQIEGLLGAFAAVLAWARDHGIRNRSVSPEGFMLEQGTGHMRIAFDPSGETPNDAATVAAIARRMNGGKDMDVSAFTTALVPELPRHQDMGATAPTRRGEARPAPEPAVVRRERSGGFGRMLVSLLILAAVVIGGMMLFGRRRGPETVVTRPDTTERRAAGDVAPAQPDARNYPNTYAPAIVPPTPAPDTFGRTTPAPTPTPMPAIPTPVTPPSSLVPSMPSEPRTSAPPAATSPATPPATAPATPPSTVLMPDSMIRNPSLDVCDSPTLDDQRQCLNSSIDRSDRGMNDVFQQLIGAMRREAGVANGAADPPEVEELRQSQRQWTTERNEACGKVSDGRVLFARDRATCFAERANARQRELQQRLDAIP